MRRQYNGKTTVISNNGVGIIGHPHTKINKLDTSHISYKKLTQKNLDINIHTKEKNHQLTLVRVKNFVLQNAQLIN